MDFACIVLCTTSSCLFICLFLVFFQTKQISLKSAVPHYFHRRNINVTTFNSSTNLCKNMKNGALSDQVLHVGCLLRQGDGQSQDCILSESNTAIKYLFSVCRMEIDIQKVFSLCRITLSPTSGRMILKDFKYGNVEAIWPIISMLHS